MPVRLPRKLAAVVYADVAGYSRLSGEDEDGTHRRLSEHLDLISAAIKEHQGRVVHYAGDAVLADFCTVSEALACSASIQGELTARNRDLPDERKVQFRIGVNLGEVIVDRDDIYGDGVNVAARLEGLAEPGGICISESVRNAIGKKLKLDYEFMGEQKVKNIEQPVRAYRVLMEEGKENATTPISVIAEASDILDKPSIAVLPFLNLSGDKEQEYFADGITEDIITALSRLHWFLVISRNSTFVYKNRSLNIQAIGKELGANYLLEGSVRRSGSRLRVTAQLIDAETGAHHWGQNYDRELTDIFELQDDITQSVTAAIEPKLMAAEGLRSGSRSIEDLNAWGLVTRALAHYGRMTSRETEAAIGMLREAVQKFPDYGPAQSLLAFSLLVSDHVGWSPGGNVLAKASQLAHRAVELDDDDPWAHLALGYLAFVRRDTDDTVRRYQRALDLNPNFSTAHGYMGWTLAFDGQPEEALKYFEHALRMSPHDPLKAFFYSGSSVAHYYARRYRDAVDWARKAIVQRPGFTAAHRILCASLAQAGETDRAREAMAKLSELQPNISISWIQEHVPYTPRAMPHFLEGMRKAGLE